MPELQDIYKHPMVQELIQQNQMMADQLPDAGFQNLSLSKKINLDNIKIPHTIKNRLLFQEGVHNGLFYPGDQLKENLSLWDNNDIMYAEHTDASNSWVGLTKNPHYVENEKAIYGDLELVDKGVAQKLEYQILNKDGHMGLSPTIDVDKQMVGGKLCAMGPYKLKSQSIVLDPAVKTTMFNSNSASGGAGTMEPNNELQKLQSEELAKKKKEEEEKMKADQKELQDYRNKELATEVEELAKLELAIGKCTEENLAERTEILMKLSSGERKVLKNSYDWVANELSEKSEEEMFLDKVESSQELAGKIPPGLRKFIEEKKKKKAEEKKKKEEEMAKLTPAERKKKEEEEKNLADVKKYPYPEQKPGQKLHEDFETLSRATEQLIGKNSLNRFQELSAQNKEDNQEFLDMLRINQGDSIDGGAR